MPRQPARTPEEILFSLIEYFNARVKKMPNGCWEWQGSLSKLGYGLFYAGSRAIRAHRWSYEHFVGPIPDGLIMDHLFRNRKCVNPQHVEPVTNKENILRGESPPAVCARKNHCANGHEFTKDNTYITYRGNRSCRTCRRLQALDAYHNGGREKRNERRRRKREKARRGL